MNSIGRIFFTFVAGPFLQVKMATSSMHTVLVVGGTSGIGLAFVRRFHSMGKKVIITGRRKERLASLASEIPGLETYAFDFGNLETAPAEVDAIFTRHPDIDTVFLNAGLQHASNIKDLSSSTDAKVIEEVGVNVTAPMLFARRAVPKLLQSGKPTTLMFNSSGLGFVPVGALFPVYCATKAAVHTYAVGLRQALKGTNVSVVEIVPPFVGDTELGLEYRELVKGLTPLPLKEFEDAVFEVLDTKEAADLKEVSAGSGVSRVEAWRNGTGKILEQGLGG